MAGGIALVVGGSGGIGRKVAAVLAEAGTTVIAAGRSPQLAREVSAEWGALTARIRYHQVDIVDNDACTALIADIVAEHGGIDSVVDCANIPVRGMTGAFRNVDPRGFAAMVEGSLTATFNLCHAALPAMAGRGDGSIVLFASDSGKVAAPNQTMIGSTRAAIMMFARSLALEVAHDGIRVNCVSPSFVRDTPVYDMVMSGPIAARARTAAARAGLGLPASDDVAQLVGFLCSDAARHLTGQVVSVNGGVSAA